MFLQSYPPALPLERYIDSFLVQEDFNPFNYANRNPVKVLPTVMTVIGIQYGQPMRRLENGRSFEMGTSGITGMQAGTKEYVSTGAIGTIIVQFKPGGLAAFTRYPLHEFQDANVPLDQVFPKRNVAELEEKLAEAAGAAERVGIVGRFLESALREREEDKLILNAARLLMKRHGAVSIERLAAESFISRRTLERKFNSLIGSSPKHFASIVRFQHTIGLRNAGHSYLDIVHAAGYADHAHFAKDFKAFAGDSPETFFRGEFQPELKRTFNPGSESPSSKQHLYY